MKIGQRVETVDGWFGRIVEVNGDYAKVQYMTAMKSVSKWYTVESLKKIK